MRLLIVTSEYVNLSADHKRGSGIARVVFEASEELKKNGVEVEICSPEGPHVVVPSTGFPGRIGLVFFWQNALKELRKIDQNYDAIWLHNPILLRKYRAKRPMVATVHSTSLGKNRQFRSLFFTAYVFVTSVLEVWSNREIARSGFEVTCVSESVCNELINIGPERKRIVRNGSIFPVVLKAPQSGSRKDASFLYVGRLDKIKNVRRIIRLYGSIKKEVEGCSLVIIGDGPEYASLRSENKDSSISFKGFLDHDAILPYYDEAEFFFMASIYEGCPLTLLDAVNRGLRCVVPNIPSLAFVEDMGLGKCYDNGDDKMASRELIDYVRQSSGKPRTNRVDFTWKSAIDQYIDLFKGNRD
ncbi:MAG TPA: glycosyltransferase family 4 protein [Methanomassiliicoccales archaeon]|jgi:glycosyltransferase involved in cell wall biosynthesis